MYDKPNLGDKIRVTPSAFTDPQDKSSAQGEVTGTVVYINTAHRFFSVEFDLNGFRFRESFKFQ